MREIMTDVVTTILLAIITMGVTVVCDTVRKAGTSWLEKIRDDAENKNLEISASMFQTANKLLASVTYNAVAAMEQTKASEIREKVKAGLVDRSQLTILAKDVLYSVKEQLTPDVTDILSKYVGDLDKYIETQIESYLLEVKNTKVQAIPLLEATGILNAGMAAQDGYSENEV